MLADEALAVIFGDVALDDVLADQGLLSTLNT
jgi:hypothetical protein